MDPNNQPSAESSQPMAESIAPDPFTMPPYWHKDGDTILLVEDDNKTEHRFRVHRSMLCLHSPVFRDMFSLGENVVKEDDIPAVPMKGDSVEDVRELLKVIYKGFELYCGMESMSFEGTLGILRLSHKYQMEQLKNSVVELLKRIWPLNYEEYNQVLLSLSPAQKRSRIDRSIKLINAARLTECYELLPTAFFELSSLKGVTWTSEIGGVEFLCPEDWLRMTRGKVLWMERLKSLESAGTFVEHMAYMRVERDDSGEPISRPVHDLMLAQACVKLTRRTKILDGDSLVDGCRSWTAQTFQNERVCSACAHWMNSLIRGKEIEIWANVPKDFDLPGVSKDEYTKTSTTPLSFFF